MASRGTNRFALLDGDNTSPDAHRRYHPTGDHSIGIDYSFLRYDDTGWQEVKPRGGGTQAKGVRTLVIRNDSGKQPAVATRRPTVSTTDSHMSHETSSGYSLRDTANENARPANPLENWCGVCHRKFDSKLAIQNHIKQMESHHNYCNLCKRVFKDRNGLQNHVQNTPGHDVFCNLCLSAFKDSWGLRNHFDNKRAVGHQFVCLACLEGFKGEDHLSLHLRTSPNHVRCNTCHRNFKDQDERDNHWKMTKKHKHCLEPGCDFDGPHAAALEQHIENDHFRCEGCRTIFDSHTKLNSHHEKCQANLHPEPWDEYDASRNDLSVAQKMCSTTLIQGLPIHEDDTILATQSEINTESIDCWLCKEAMKSYTALFKHLETGKCSELPDPSLLIQVLGKWYHSTLYMDISLHAQIRQGRVNVQEMMGWIKEGHIEPYLCRAEGCDKTFSYLRALVRHWELKECEYEIGRLRPDLLGREIMDALQQNGTVEEVASLESRV